MRIGWLGWRSAGLLFALVAACTNGLDPADAGLPTDGPRYPWDSPRPPDARPVPPPDAGRPDADLTGCTLAPQAGCPSPMACDLDGDDLASGATECRAVTAEGTEQSICDQASECAAGYICRGTSVSVCRRFCSADADCGTDRSCVLQIGAGTTTVPGALVCSDACDPVTALGCAATLGCNLYLDATGTVPFALCARSGTGGQGAGCESDANCQPGYVCVDPGSAPRCLSWCTLAPTASGCPSGGVCTGFTAPRVYRGITYGACAPES